MNKDYLVKDRFDSAADALRTVPARAQMAESVQRLIEGVATVDEVAGLPWHDTSLCKHLIDKLSQRNRELEEHRATFKALRKVFGPT